MRRYVLPSLLHDAGGARLEPPDKALFFSTDGWHLFLRVERCGLTSFTLDDYNPAGVTYVSDTPSQGTYDDGTGVWQDNPAMLDFVQGPDFPTGGVIHGRRGIYDYVTTGRGRVVVRAKTETEIEDNGRAKIIVTEIPYQVNKSTLIEKIANLVRGGTIEGISDLRDAARVLKGRKVADGVLTLVVPGSGRVKAQAEAEGLPQLLAKQLPQGIVVGCQHLVRLGRGKDQFFDTRPEQLGEEIAPAVFERIGDMHHSGSQGNIFSCRL